MADVELTAEGYRNRILTDLDAPDSLRPLVAACWQSQVRFGQGYTRYLYAKQDFIRVLIGRLHGQPRTAPVDEAAVDWARLRLSALKILLDQVQLEVKAIRRSGGNLAVVSGTSAQNIVDSPPDQADANDPFYGSGNPNDYRWPVQPP